VAHKQQIRSRASHIGHNFISFKPQTQTSFQLHTPKPNRLPPSPLPPYKPGEFHIVSPTNVSMTLSNKPEQTMSAMCCDKAPASRELQNVMRYRTDVPVPQELPPKGYARVRVLAAGIAVDEVNTAERTFLGRFGNNPKNYSPEKPLVPGLECCGEIVALGEEAKSSGTGKVSRHSMFVPEPNARILD
jgi:hypothetical protein